MTRDPTSASSQYLATLPKVSLYTGQTDNEDDLKGAFSGIDLAHVNLNSFALGIKEELYWGIRIYEIAVQSGVKHFIWSSLDRFMADTKYDDETRVIHYYGKAYVEQWLSAIPQRKDSTRWTIMTTGPYIEMLSQLLQPRQEDDGTYVFEVPLGDGLVPFIHLDDLGHYVNWIFSNPDESAGMNLKIAIEHASYEYLVSTFTKVTGKPAKYRNVSFDEWFTTGPLSPVADVKLGKGRDDSTLLTNRENFTAWWKLYQLAGKDREVLKRDYELLDRIFPGRVRTVEEWMRKVGYTGEARFVLKAY